MAFRSAGSNELTVGDHYFIIIFPSTLVKAEMLLNPFRTCQVGVLALTWTVLIVYSLTPRGFLFLRLDGLVPLACPHSELI
jgi:hypothetical protein